MSILKRPGWANYEILNEGRLHNDKLKDKIGKMFDRLSLGYSPNHVIDKIANIIRSEKGNKFDVNELSHDYIINVANSDSITRGKFTPSLKSSFANEYQNTNNISDISTFSSDLESSTSSSYTEPTSLDFSTSVTSDVSSSIPIGSIPSEDSEEKTNEDDEEKYNDEDAEEVKTCGCEKHDQVFSKDLPKENLKKVEQPKPLEISANKSQHKQHKSISKESVKLSPKAVNKLLQENYIKQKQHLTKIEEKYRI